MLIKLGEMLAEAYDSISVFEPSSDLEAPNDTENAQAVGCCTSFRYCQEARMAVPKGLFRVSENIYIGLDVVSGGKLEGTLSLDNSL